MKKLFSSVWTYVVIAVVIGVVIYSRTAKADDIMPGIIPYPDGTNGNTGDGTGNTGGSTGGTTASAPTRLTFRDFTAMRYIGNDGKLMGQGSTTPGNFRRVGDPLYSATGFFIPAGNDTSAFIVGEPVKILAGTSVANPHFDEGIFTLKAIIPAIPGAGTDQRGTWLVTSSSWRDGSQGKEPGLIEQL